MYKKSKIIMNIKKSQYPILFNFLLQFLVYTEEKKNAEEECQKYILRKILFYQANLSKDS